MKTLLIAFALTLSANAFADASLSISCQPREESKNEKLASGASLSASVTLLADNVAQGGLNSLRFVSKNGFVSEYSDEVKPANFSVKYRAEKGGSWLDFVPATDGLSVKYVALVILGDIANINETEKRAGVVSIRIQNNLIQQSELNCTIKKE